MPIRSEPIRRNPVWDGLLSCRRHFVAAAIFSAASNILYLTPTIYMMQVYDRVVPTGGLMTLAAISLVALAGLATLSALDWLRGRLLIRASAQLEAQLAGPTIHLTMVRTDLSRPDRAEALREMDILRRSIASPGAVAILDAPWAPVYVLAAFALHPALGLLTLLSAIVLMILAWSNERAIKAPVAIVSDAANLANSRQAHATDHAAEIRAMGMGSALARRQLDDRAHLNDLQTRVGFVAGHHAGIIKFLRLTLQSAALGVGAILAVRGSVSGGAVFAASLLLSRALQPIEQIVGSWKTLLTGRLAYAKLTTLFTQQPTRIFTRLPQPTGALHVERLTVLAPQSDRIALADASFRIAAGEIIGVVGQSGAGKSTLLRAIAGAAEPLRGHIRFDGAASTDWDSEELARHIGYVGQDFALFPGSVANNIARFRGLLGDDPALLDDAVVSAAKAVGAHDMIQRLPHGYDTVLGPGGVGLSSGQSQRIALARAMFANPRLLILDEPTAHLDAEAQHAFIRLLSQLRQSRTTVIFATHSSEILASADKLLLLKDGRIERFEPLAEAIPTLRPVPHVAQRAS